MDSVNLPKPRCTQYESHSGIHHSPKRTISVMASGVAVCSPDTFSFNVTVCSTKSALTEAQASVKRRGDYILQVLRNHNIRNIRSLTDMWTEANGEEHVVEMSISVQCGDVEKCSKVRNTIMEKLDSPSVHCSSIGCSHTPEWKATKMKEAFSTAVANAKAKAQSVSQTVGLRLGPVLTLSELQQCEESSCDPSHQEGGRQGRRGMTRSGADHDLTGRIREATVEYSSQVTAVFEALTNRNCSHKKCRKHTNCM